MRTDALRGIPNINNYISAFIIIVNMSTTAITPYLVRYIYIAYSMLLYSSTVSYVIINVGLYL